MTLAIKTIRLDIPPRSPQYQQFLERFIQEVRIAGTLSHPHIVTLFDMGQENDVPFLAMEFVDGKTIADLLEEGTPFKPERVIGLVSQVAEAVDYAHAKGVIHRDIKPSNLIVYEGDKVKVTDFGIAKLADSEITHSGALLGTPSYMSPEQAMGEKLDGRSDIFSLGVVAFEMLSGQQPFPGANVTSILYKLVHVTPSTADSRPTAQPQKWRGVLLKVLAKAENCYPRRASGDLESASARGSRASQTRKRSACRCRSSRRARSPSRTWRCRRSPARWRRPSRPRRPNRGTTRGCRPPSSSRRPRRAATRRPSCPRRLPTRSRGPLRP
jgi:serine/threonine-protein kinase